MADREKTSTIEVYASDKTWFQTFQRETNGRLNKWHSMPDIVRHVLGILAELEGSDA